METAPPLGPKDAQDEVRSLGEILKEDSQLKALSLEANHALFFKSIFFCKIMLGLL